MTRTLSNKCAKNLSKRTVLLQLIIKNVVTCFFGTQCIRLLGLSPPPTFQTPRLSGFWAPPPFFVTCNAYYEAVFCGLPNNKMTPNDSHANQTTILSSSTHDRSGLSHDIVLPGTIDNSVLSLIISVLSFKGIHNGICNLRFSLCVQAYCKGGCRRHCILLFVVQWQGG